MIAPVDWFIGIRYIYARRGNHFSGFISLTAIVATALGVTVLLTILSIMNGFEGEVRDRILGLAAHLEVDSAAGGDWPTMLKTIGAQPGVVAAAPYVSRDVLIAERGAVRAVEVRGIDAAREIGVTQLEAHLKAGSLADLDKTPFGVVIGRELADSLGVTVGARLTLITPQPSVTPAGLVPRLKRFVVTGIFEFGLQEYDAGLVLINLSDAQRLFRSPDAIDGVRIKLLDGGQASAMKQQLAAVLGRAAEGDTIRDWTDTHRNLFRALHIEKTVMFVILALAIGIAAFNVVSILVVAVTDKRSDIAMLGSLGLERRDIMWVFLVQGGVTGAIGVVTGVVCGALLSANIDVIVAAVEQLFSFKVLSPDVYYISNIPSELRGGDFVVTTVLAALLSLAAPLYPAWLAATTNLSEGLRHD
jgi:lipoprotein-releasing system permease protein